MKKSLLVLTAILWAATGDANPTQLAVSFQSNPNDLGGSGLSFPFGGRFTYDFDRSLVPASGVYSILDVPVDTLSLDHPLIGNTTFDRSNTTLEIYFDHGAFDKLFFGDRIDPSGTGIGVDDFSFLIYFQNPSLPAEYVFYASTAYPDVFAADFAPKVDFSLRNVPESIPTFLMVGLGAWGIAGLQRHTRKR